MKIKTMFKAILSLAVCLMVVSVISVTVSAAEYEEIKMDVSVTTHKDNTYQIYIPYNGDVVLEYDLSVFPVCEIMRCDSDSGKKLIKSMVLRTADRQGMC